MNCSECGKELKGWEKYCPNCGKKIKWQEQPKNVCRNCRAEIKPGEMFCRECINSFSRAYKKAMAIAKKKEFFDSVSNLNISRFSIGTPRYPSCERCGFPDDKLANIEEIQFCPRCGAPMAKKEIKENTDKVGIEVWQELKDCLSKKFDVYDEEPDSFMIDYKLENDITYPVLVMKHENSDRTENWLQVCSPIPDLETYILGEDSLSSSLNILDSYLCGGIFSYEGVYFIRSSMPLVKMEMEKLLRVIETVCAAACKISFSVLDEYKECYGDYDDDFDEDDEDEIE